MAQHDEHVGPASPLDQSLGQPTLPHAGLASDESYSPPTGAGRGEACVKELQLSLPADQRSPRFHMRSQASLNGLVTAFTRLQGLCWWVADAVSGGGQLGSEHPVTACSVGQWN
jgi:hypothetical protein